ERWTQLHGRGGLAGGGPATRGVLSRRLVGSRGQIARGAHQRAGRVVDAGPRAGLEAARVALEVPDDPADRHRLVDLYGGHAARAARRVQHLDRAGSGVGRPRLQPDVGRVELARLRERGELRGRYLRTAVEAGDAVGDATVGPLDTA